MPEIRWGLIGAGRIAHTFAHDIRSAGNAELIAIGARDEARARDFAHQYGAQFFHGNYQSLYENPEVDAVYIATPHSFHLQNCIDAMKAGKAVLCEKPLVLNPEECRELIAAHEQTGQYLMEGMWTWFLPAIRRAREWVKQGRIGELLHVKADFGYPLVYSEELREYDARVGGGAVLEMGVYPVALARYFIESEPHSFQVRGRTAANGVEDDVSAVLGYDHATATLGTSFRCKLQNWAYIIGSEGYIAIPDFWRAERCFLYQLHDVIDSFIEERDTEGFNHQIEAVSADILDGRRQSELIPLQASLDIQRDMARIIEAARS